MGVLRLCREELHTWVYNSFGTVGVTVLVFVRLPKSFSLDFQISLLDYHSLNKSSILNWSNSIE